MSDYDPPSGPPEYLESGSSSPDDSPGPAWEAPPEAEPTAARRRTPWVVAIAVVVLLGGGAAAWAVLSFFRQGAQPAEALPASTVAYVSIDLDPSGSQKIDAFRTLNKFPSFKDQLGVNSPGDVRRKLGEALMRQAHCSGMTYSADIAPWVGDRAALAAVDVGGSSPAPVAVLQVKDEGKAETALARLARCDTSSGGGGYAVENGWALFGDSQRTIDRTVAATKQGSLADDATYRKWVGKLGDSGVVTMYAAPKAGLYLADQLNQYAQLFADPQGAFATTAPARYTTTSPDPTHRLAQELRHFEGAAATIRFTSHGIQLATVAQANLSATKSFAGDQAGTATTRLPDDTAAAFSMSLKPGWVSMLAGSMSRSMGGGASRARFYREVEQLTGLRLPGDLETLLGSSTTFAVGGDFDYEAVSNATDGRHVPIGAVIQGDSAKISSVLARLRGDDAALAQLLGSDSSGRLVALGPSSAYRSQLLHGGHLGDTTAFQDVVPSPGHASEILFVNMAQLQKSMAEAAGGDQQAIDNLKPLEAIGFSAWQDGDVGRISLEVSTH